jgi:putative exporter of polyketide antibiotics
LSLRLYRIQLVRERWLLLGWALGLMVYFFIIGISYATVKDHEAGLDALWQELPEAFRKAFGDSPSITTPGGYFEARGTSLLPLVLGGALVAQATRRLSGAEQAGELDLVLSLPIRRSTYFWSHWGVGVTHAVAWLAASAIGAVAGMAIAGTSPGDLARIAFMVAETLPFVLAVHAGAVFAGAALHRRPPGTAILAGSLAASFLVQIVGSLDESMEWLLWFSPYAMWVRGDPFQYQPDIWYLIVSVLLVAGFLPFAARIWGRKDLKG